VVSFGGKPGVIPDEVVDYINNSLKRIGSKGGLKKGETIQIQEGPFRGIEGLFQAYDGEERAIVLISFMQSQHRVKVRLGDL
jgi:transcriptional antiterminator RfaH